MLRQRMSGLIEALARHLADDRLEPAFVALALAMPSEGDIAREIGRDIDPDANFALAHTCEKLSCRARTARSMKPIARCKPAGPYSPDAASAPGAVRLKNTALDLLAATGQQKPIQAALSQYRTADNMTDRMAALSVLSQHDVPARARRFPDFYKRCESDPLIIDQMDGLAGDDPGGWHARPRPRAHLASGVFDEQSEPRALIGSFAHGNATQFNRADGLGYDFVADAVLTLDAKNPQVASRLATSFRSWRVLESERRAKAQSALRRIAAASALSADVDDIVSRALAEP